jgi:hypothetical protein
MPGLRVVHDIPGRVRLRLPAAAQTEGLPQAVASEPGVTSCAWAPRTRSVLVRYEPGVATSAAVIESVARHAGVELVRNNEEAGRQAHTSPTVPGDALAQGVKDAVGELDRRIQRASRGLVAAAAKTEHERHRRKSHGGPPVVRSTEAQRTTGGPPGLLRQC